MTGPAVDDGDAGGVRRQGWETFVIGPTEGAWALLGVRDHRLRVQARDRRDDGRSFGGRPMSWQSKASRTIRPRPMKASSFFKFYFVIVMSQLRGGNLMR